METETFTPVEIAEGPTTPEPTPAAPSCTAEPRPARSERRKRAKPKRLRGKSSSKIRARIRAGETPATTLLDRFTVELRVSAEASPELLRDALRRLDEGKWWRRVPLILQAALNSTRLEDMLVTIRR